MQKQPDQTRPQRTRNFASGAIGFFLFVSLAIFAATMGSTSDQAVQPATATLAGAPAQGRDTGAEDIEEVSAGTSEDTEDASAGTSEDTEASEASEASEAAEDEVLADPAPEAATTDSGGEEAATTSVQLQQAQQVLAADVPVTALVLGDSTSDDTRKWVHLWARSLAGERPVSIAHWDGGAAPAADYYPAVKLSTDGAGSPLMIWNGSVADGSAGSAQENLGGFVPEPPDVVLLNFGRTTPTGDFPAQMGTLVDDIRGRFGDVPVLMIAQNPVDATADRQVRDAGEQWAAQADVGVLDVAGEFPALDEDLPVEATSTSAKGQQLWAGFVTNALD